MVGMVMRVVVGVGAGGVGGGVGGVGGVVLQMKVICQLSTSSKDMLQVRKKDRFTPLVISPNSAPSAPCHTLPSRSRKQYRIVSAS